MQRIRRAIELRNEEGHGMLLSDENFEGHEQQAHSAIDALLGVTRGFDKTELVSVADVQHPEDNDEDIVYDLRVHMGSSEVFPLKRKSMSKRLSQSWCYLLCEEGEPLSLSPLVMAGICPTCGRPEVFLANKIVLGPRGATVDGYGMVVSNHKMQCRIQWNARAAELYSAVVQNE